MGKICKDNWMKEKEMTDAFRELTAEDRSSGASRTLTGSFQGLLKVVTKRCTTNDERVEIENLKACETVRVYCHDSRAD